MNQIKPWLWSSIAVLAGVGVLFVLARAGDEFFSRPGNQVASALSADAHYFGGFIALAAGYVTALLARRRCLTHAGVLAVVAAGMCLAQGYGVVSDLLGDIFAGAPPTLQQWLNLIGNDVVPAVFLAAMVLVGGVLRVCQQQNTDGHRTLAVS
jgi:hypothetical protein